VSEQLLARDATLMAVDFESTGHAPGYSDTPWQIGVVPVVRGEVIHADAFVSYLHVPADRPFSPFAPGSWQTVRDELAIAPALPALWPVLRKKIVGVPLIAHNAATEKKFFRKAWPLHKVGPWIDTLKLARLAFKDLKSFELSLVVEAAGIKEELDSLLPGRAAHDALYDATASAMLLCHLLRQRAWRDLSVGELCRAASARKPARLSP
jgi:DNA polymerase-3 subunit epsilon